MSRATIVLILVVLILVGGVAWLSSVDTSVPQTQVVKPVAAPPSGGAAGGGAAGAAPAGTGA